jgi:hypothetical protein
MEDTVNALIRSFALAVAFGTAGATASAKTARSAPESARIAQPAPEKKTAQATDGGSNGSVAAPASPARSDQQSMSGQRSGRSADDEAIQQQLQFRVLLPPLSGDGGS